MMKSLSKKYSKLLNIFVLGIALTTLSACGSGLSDSPANSDSNSTLGEDESSVSEDDSQVITDFFVNQRPVFKAHGSHSAKADAGPMNVENWAYDIDDGDEGVTQNLKFVLTNDRPDLFDVQPEVGVETGNLTYNAKNKLSGTALISLSLVDDGGVEDEGENSSVPYNFAINVDPSTVVVAPLIPNKKPTFIANGDHSSKATDGPQALRGWAHDLNDGDKNASQSMNFSVLSNSAPGLFDVQPTVSVPSGTLRYNAKNTVSGKSEITIILQDDGGTEEGGEDTSGSFTFSIDITAPDLNHSPTFLPGGNVSVDSSSGSYEKDWATKMDDGDPSSQAMKFEVLSNENPSLFTKQPWVSYPSGKLRFTPKDGVNGTATISIRLRDNGGANFGGSDVSKVADFRIYVESTTSSEDGLPPDPGEEGKTTILGIDTDNDGIRDDVQIAISSIYPNNDEAREALKSVAKNIQKSILGVMSSDELKLNESFSEMTKVMNCLLISSDSPYADLVLIETLMMNTDGRMEVMGKVDLEASGQFFEGGLDFENACN